MKEVRRDFTAIVQVPDDASIDDVEIVAMIDAFYASQRLDPSISAEDPYEVEQEKPVPPKPKCPRCQEEVDSLWVSWRANNIPGYASIVDGELYTDVMDDIKSYELVIDGSAVYYCPKCEETLFKAGEEDKMEEFLKNVPSNA